MTFYSCDSPSHAGKTNTWFTPQECLKDLGAFDLDPCTESYRPFDIAKNNYCFDKGEDGLKLPWNGRVFLNPPYGRHTSKWLDRAYEHGNAVALIFASFDTLWGQKHLRLADGVHFIKGRISFIKADLSKANNAGKGSCFLIYGKNNLSYFEDVLTLRTPHF